MTASEMPLVIAIDGPSGAGKSSVSRAVAQRLDLGYLDTGAMYRALTWWCIQEGIDLADEPVVTRTARELPLHMDTHPESPSVKVGGVPIDEAIRSSVISRSVSIVAVNQGVRQEMCRRQPGGMVAEGRDVTTVIAPDANVRILLSASQEARVLRRAKELHGETGESAVSDTYEQIVHRDRDDSAVSEFMQAAPGVTFLDTSDLDFQQSVEAVMDLVRDQSRPELDERLASGPAGAPQRARGPKPGQTKG